MFLTFLIIHSNVATLKSFWNSPTECNLVVVWGFVCLDDSGSCVGWSQLVWLLVGSPKPVRSKMRDQTNCTDLFQRAFKQVGISKTLQVHSNKSLHPDSSYIHYK